MDEKTKKNLGSEIAMMDVVVEKQKYNNKLNMAWRQLKSTLMDQLVSDQSDPNLSNPKLN